jgi:hypothetical protein
MARKFDIRQSVYRGILQQLFPYMSGKQVDVLLSSIDFDLAPPLRTDASSSPDLTVHIGPSVVSNTVSGRQKSIPHIQNVIPTLTSGTVTFPAVNGGTIVVSPGSNSVLNLPVNEYCKVLLSLDSSGNIIVSQGAADPVEANAAVPPPVANTLPFAYVSLFNNAGVVQNVVQNKIFQFGSGGGSGSGSVQAGFAQEVALSSGSTSKVVTFPSPLPGTNYVVLAQFVNETDPSPEFQDIVITNKSPNGFTANWNAPLDSSNYLLDYVVPVVQEQVGEAIVGNGVTSITVTLPIALAGPGYSVIAQLVNYVDGFPQFQTVAIVQKTSSTFTASWNNSTDSANYRLAYHVAQYQ